MFKRNKDFTSLSKQLLKVVFTFYFIITILMTIGHFIVEYYHTQDNIKEELKTVSTTFETSLEQAMWNFDNQQIDSILNGALKLPAILSIELYDKNTKAKIHTTKNNFNKYQTGVFSYLVDIFHIKINNEKVYIGTVEYYSSSNIVFERVKLGFIIILVNALLKSLLLTILFIWAFNKYLTNPLDKITRNILDVDLDKVSKHKPIIVNKKNKNELTLLSSAFNKMLKNLDEKLNALKNTQKHLIQSEKMVALGNMVAGVAHEINTPVGMALTGVTHLEEQTKNLKKLYNDENMTEEDFEHYLNDTIELNHSIHINLQKAASLVKSFKKVAVDQSSNETRTFNLKQYIQEILLSLRNKLKQTNIKVIIHCDDNLIITSNPGAISQIITNFTMNSLIHGFNPEDIGTIIISAKISNNRLELLYKDSGKGLDAISKNKIFDPFFTTKRGEGGSGLGMSIVYNLVTSTLHGSISVSSEPSYGTSFIIDIPIKH